MKVAAQLTLGFGPLTLIGIPMQATDVLGIRRLGVHPVAQSLHQLH